MFYNRFLKLCEKNEIKPSVAANEIGFNKSTVSAWKRNGNTPNREILFKVANYFNVSIEYLMTGEEQKEKPAIEEDSEFLQTYKKLMSLPIDARQDVIRYIDYIVSQQEK